MLKQIKEDRSIHVTISLIIALGIFLFSSIQVEQSSGAGGPIPIIAIAYHVLSFLTLSFFVHLAAKPQKPASQTTIIFLLLIYAILDEFHQMFVSGRNSTLKDILFDTIGIIIGSILYRIKLSK